MVHKFVIPSDLVRLPDFTPAGLKNALLDDLTLLSLAYGENRNFEDSGGFVLYCTPESTADELKAVFDPEKHCPEWASVMESESLYCSALYVLNNDFTVTLYVPIAMADEAIMEELKEEIK